MTEYKMAGWHHRLDGHEFEWTPGAGDGQGGLVCYDSQGWVAKSWTWLKQFSSSSSRPPCPSPTPGVHSNSCPSSRWCHPAISSSVNPFSSCPQSLPASGSFPMSQHFAWGGQSTGVSALASFQRKDRWLAHDQDMHFDLSFHSCLGSLTHIYKGGLCAICAHKTEKN